MNLKFHLKPGRREHGQFAKFLMIMKLTTILLLGFLLQASAKGHSQSVTLVEKNVPLTKVLKEFHKQTGYYFFYTYEVVKKAGKVDVNLKNVPLSQALKVCLDGKNLTYTIVDQTVVIKQSELTPKSIQANAPVIGMAEDPSINISGVVTDENGKPLEGVSVVVKGTNRGTSTNSLGAYSLSSVDENAILVFSRVGYLNQEILVNGRAFINVKMSLSLMQQEEIVVVSTGYQTMSKERSAGAYSQPDMNVVNNRTTSMNILDRLDGQIPGLTLNKGSQGDYFQESIRGLTTINGASSPLFVVDGMIVQSLNTVNPADVADITVLKDATAASIWGARAANGVIVVTTKKGGSNSLFINYDMFYSFRGKPDVGVFPMLNSKDYIKAVQEIYNTSGYLNPGIGDWPTITTPDLYNGQTSILPHDYLLYGRADQLPESYRGTSLSNLSSMNNLGQIKKIWYRNSLLTNHTLSLSTGSNKYGIYASLGYTGDKSATPGSETDSYLLNVRQDFRVSSKLNVYLITDLTYNTSKARRAIAPDGRFVPYASFENADGKGADFSWLYRTDSLKLDYENKSAGLPDLGRIDLTYNPSLEFNSGYTKGSDLNSRILSGISYSFFKGLRFEGIYGVTLENGQVKQYDDVTGYSGQLELAKMTLPGPPIKTYLPTTGGKQTLIESAQKSWTVRNQFVFEDQWNEGTHQLTVLAGTEIQQQTLSTTTVTVRGYDERLLTSQSIDYTTTSAGLQNTIINTSGTFKINDLYNERYNDIRFRSYYANMGYTWKRTYTLNASTRIDKSNLFGKEISAQAKPVWSIGAKWKLSNEKFMKDLSWINNLNTRITYGITGNSPDPGSGGSFDILSPGFAWGVPTGSVSALTIETPGNNKLSWEKTDNLNFGIDFYVLNNRLSGSIDYYFKHTTNLLGDVAQNAFTGYDFVFGNAAAINNSGLEIALTSINVKGKNYHWESHLNFAYNKGKVVKLYNPNPFKDASSYIRPLSGAYYTPARLGLVEGYQPFTIFAYQYAGLNDNGDPQIVLRDGTITSQPGVAKMTDLIAAGSAQPLITGGLSNTFSYKNFSLDVNMVFSLKFIMRRDVNELYTGRVTTNQFIKGGIHEDFLNRWKQHGDESVTDIPAYDPAPDRRARTDLNYYTAADINIVKGDFIKMRDLVFSYSVPKRLSECIRANDINVRIQLNNIMIWRSNNFGIDPEFYNGIGLITSATEPGNFVNGFRRIPINQNSVILGVHIAF